MSLLESCEKATDRTYEPMNMELNVKRCVAYFESHIVSLGSRGLPCCFACIYDRAMLLARLEVSFYTQYFWVEKGETSSLCPRSLCFRLALPPSGADHMLTNLSPPPLASKASLPPWWLKLRHITPLGCPSRASTIVGQLEMAFHSAIFSPRPVAIIPPSG